MQHYSYLLGLTQLERFSSVLQAESAHPVQRAPAPVPRGFAPELRHSYSLFLPLCPLCSLVSLW